MSTRAQVTVKGTGVFMYQHCDGYNLFTTVKKAVKDAVEAGRFNDEEYLNRMIFNRMTKDDPMGSTGFGISTEVHGDIEYLIVVDTQKGQVFEKNLNVDKWGKRFSLPSGRTHNMLSKFYDIRDEFGRFVKRDWPLKDVPSGRKWSKRSW